MSGKRITAHTKKNNIFTKATEDVLTVAETPNPILTHTKKENSPLRERLLIEQRQNGGERVFVDNKYKFEPNGEFKLIKSQASEHLKKVAKHNYFNPYLASDARFPKRMTRAVIDEQKFIVDPTELNLFSEATRTQGYYDGGLNINRKSHRDLMQSRENLVETIGHEVGHAKWDEKSSIQDAIDYGLDMGVTYSPAEIVKIRKYSKAAQNYVSPEVSYHKYSKNFTEVTAREEGKKTLRKYNDLTDSLQKTFPYSHCEQLNKLSIKEEDSLNFLLAMIRSN